MPTIKRFEELEIWQAAKEFAVEIYKVTDPKTFKGDHSLRDQIRRASVSIMANIAEGFDRNTKKEFINFLAYSLSSASEVKSHLYLIRELGYLNSEISETLLNKATAISQRTTKLIKYLRSDSRKRGTTK